MRYSTNKIIIIVCFLFFSGGVNGQVTLWSVDFETGYSDNDQTAQDNNSPTGVDWTKTGTPSNWWRVESANVISGTLSMSGRNTDGDMTWTSESIDLTGYTNIGISILIGETNYDNDGDYVRTYYNTGSGNVEFGVGNGEGNFGGTATNSVTGLSGSSLTITVLVNNDDGGDRGLFDDIVVTGTASSLGIDGPGGVGETDGSGELELWLVAEGNTYTDAGSTGATDGQNIQQWNDASGNDHHASESDVSERPSLNTNAVNGFSTVVFDDTDERILSSSLTTNDEATIFTVFQLNGFGSGSNDGIIHAATSGNAFSGTTTTKTIGMWVSTGTGNIWGRGIESSVTIRNISQVTSLSTGQFYAITQDYDGSDITQYVNGATAGTVSYDGTLQSWTDFGIGRQGSETMDGEIAEMIAFKASANLAQRIIIQNYLAAKYAISLSSNDLYDEDDGGNGNFDFEVAGIGQASDGTSHEDAQGTGIVRMRSPSGLANSEFIIWGHDNGSLSFTSSDAPSGVGQILVRKWRASESGEVGTITISFDLANLSGTYPTDDLRLIIDSDNDGSFSDESGASVISGATNTGGSVYEWTGVDIDDNERFTIGVATLGYLGPGGVGDTDGTGTLSLWLDANQGVSESSNEVTQWDDQSGYDNHATPPAASNRPDYDGTGTNSHPIITFDGSDHYLTASDDNSLDLTTWSILIVGIINNHKNYNAFIVKGPDAQENYEFLTNFPSTGNFHYPVYYTTAARSTDAEPDETFSTSNYGIYQLDYDQSNFEFFIDGNQTETDAETRTPQTNSNELYIGNEESTTGREVDASLGEVMIYSGPLNDAQRIIVHNAMAAKYGFSLDANDNYDEDDNGFDFDVAGIGQAADGTNHLDAQGTGIVRINTASDMDNSEYLIWGHNNGALSSFGIIDLPLIIESRLARVWRVSETGDVGTVNISFDLSSVFGSIAASDLRLLIDTDNDGLFIDETVGSGGVLSGATDLGSDVFSWTGIDFSDNQRFTVGSIDAISTPLPIELLSFHAEFNHDNNVEVTWFTSSEVNNDFFIVERSMNGTHWEFVNKVIGAGNSNIERKYQTIDQSPYQGISYYRLSQTDFNGQSESFDPVAVSRQLKFNETTDSEVLLYPNPGDGNSIFVEFINFKSGKYNISILDESGKLVLDRTLLIEEGTVYLEMELLHGRTLNKGLHLIKVTSPEGIFTSKYFVK